MYLMRKRNHGGCLKVDIVAKTLEGRERANVMYKFKFCKKIDIFISWKVEQKKLIQPAIELMQDQ